jgi:acyl dehydratase
VDTLAIGATAHQESHGRGHRAPRAPDRRPEPLHFDEGFARATRFGERVVQGGITAGILNAIVAQDLPGPGSVFMEQRLRYSAPVRPGDTITGEVEVTALREDKPIVTLAVRVTRQDGVRVLEGEALVYVMHPAAR